MIARATMVSPFAVVMLIGVDGAGQMRFHGALALSATSPLGWSDSAANVFSRDSSEATFLFMAPMVVLRVVDLSTRLR
jgi:hypothetical protein